MANHSLPSQKQARNAGEASLSPTLGQKILKLFGWQFWATVVMVAFGATGYAATSALLSLNTPKGCESVYWPLASGARRLYCAQVEAKEGDGESLLEAIALVSKLPDDHPLREEIDKNIKVWSEQVLQLGEKHFQAGNLDAAMAIADNIPAGIAAKAVIDEKVERWNAIWEKGETIEANVEAQLNQAAWNLAFKEAGKLVDLDNEYLANRRYTELVAKIQQAKIEGAVLDEARNAYDRGGVQNLLTAIEKAETIDADSYSYQAAQTLIAKVGETLIKKAQENLDRRRWNTVLDITQAIPESLGLEDQVADFRQIALAGLESRSGTLGGLREAIAQAETIGEERPLYNEAQNLISRWETEIDDVQVLNLAKGYANGGTRADLRAAMAKADEVPRGNPRYQEARQLVNQWNRRVQTIEDRPILNRAEEIARGGNVNAYRSAIAVAQEIEPNRALYREAQGKIRNWRNRIQRIEDQPILNQATQLANQGQLERAIATANQISSNRALYREAQGKIRNWRSDLRARESLRQASQIAAAETVEAFTRAIQNGLQARNSSTYRYQAERLIDRWSKEIYAIALQRASENNLATAISIARQVPSQSSVYQEVRLKIRRWQEELTADAED
jgi:soluble cytochrome b562